MVGYGNLVSDKLFSIHFICCDEWWTKWRNELHTKLAFSGFIHKFWWGHVVVSA